MAITSCNYCGKLIKRRPSGINQGNNFCSLSCSAKHKSRTHRSDGKYNPNWKGGISFNNYHYKKLQIQRYPQRIKARVIVSREIRAGRLIRGHCAICNFDKTEAHHIDYNKPLNIVWLCKKHHRELHDFTPGN